jgi:hypothetical protein
MCRAIFPPGGKPSTQFARRSLDFASDLAREEPDGISWWGQQSLSIASVPIGAETMM